MKNWAEELPIAITVTDAKGKIIEMNRQSAEVFAKYGGTKLIGQALNDCHNAASQNIIATLADERKTNVYTIEKNGRKKMIFQGPWFEDGHYAGLVEISFVLPDEVPHFVR